METANLNFDRETARDLWRKYKADQHWEGPIDAEIRSAYQKIAQGKLVIQALRSITDAGLNEDGLPKLAIARADADRCHMRAQRSGSASMLSLSGKPNWNDREPRARDRRFEFSSGSFEFPEEVTRRYQAYEALAPICPIHLRPKRAMSNYHILWEAEWGKAVPIDPMLLRRIGKGDLWVVLAVWDLTEVERAALSARLQS